MLIEESGARNAILLASLLVFVVLLSGCTSQTEGKVYHVGVLSGLGFFDDTTDGFREKMTELGYIEGQNIVYDIQKTDFDMDAYNRILEKFVADKVDLIFVFPTEASQQAKKTAEGTGIPVVFANAFTEDTGLVNSVREPGGNITGVRWDGPDLALQRFDILHELVPNAKRIWIPYQNGYPIVRSQLEALRPVLAAANITMLELPADNTTELESKLNDASFNSDTDVILLIAEPLGVTPENFAVLGKFAYEHKIPLGGAFMSFGGYESLFGVTPQNVPQGRQAAFLADKILKGVPSGTLPVVSAENYFQLNYREIQKLGINVNEGLLAMADEIIR